MHEPVPDGRIEVISGCMFAGKTEELLRRVRRAEIADQTVTIVKPAIDDRHGTEVIGTHNEATRKATVIDPDQNLDKLRSLGETAHVIGIDEGNFFTDDLIPVVQDLADNGVRVIITGTDQTFRGDPFEPMNNLMAISDDTLKLSAVCTVCGNQATRNQRLINGDPAPTDSPTIQVGGNESYEARCRSCHTLPQ